MTREQRELVKEGRRLAQRLYASNMNCVSNDAEHNKLTLEFAKILDGLCDELEGCNSEKSFTEHFIVLAGGKCWWSEDSDN